MRKSSQEVDLLDISKNEYRSVRNDKVKKADINILLNRVKLTKKTELKKRIIFLSLLISAIILVSVLTLI